MTRENFLIVPGLNDSDADHWQSRWERQFDLPRVAQRDWCTPNLEVWAQTLGRAVRRLPGPVVILAHSFGCLAAVFAAAALSDQVIGALLVAPAAPENFGLADRLARYALPFLALLVGSRNDPWMTIQQANWWAGRWQTGFVDLGTAGHINSAAGFGDWPGGWELARSLTGSRQRPRALRSASTEWFLSQGAGRSLELERGEEGT